jgi:hypothetical protein
MKSILALVGLALSSAALAKPVVSGELLLPKSLNEKAKGIRTIFISIQDPKAASPMPCAAQKFTIDKDAEGTFLKFTLDTDSLMMMACPTVPEVMSLKVKLDKDGSAGRDSAGDIVGVAQKVKKGATNVKVILDKASE